MVASGQDLLDVEVQVRKRRHIEFEELPGAGVPSKRRGKDIGLPDRLRVQSLDEAFDVAGIPRREAFTGDVQAVLSNHCGLLPVSGRAGSPIELLRSPNGAVTCLRSPSTVDFEVRIFSAGCLRV